MSATARLMAVAAAWALAGCSALGGGRDAMQYDPPVDAGQPEFVQPGCAKEDGTCPRSKTAHCAVDLAGQGQMICTEDLDCEMRWLTPRCLALCEPYAFNLDESDLAAAAKQAQIDRYCAMGSCVEQPCPDVGDAGWYPACVLGFCAAIRPDAGPDAGAPDADVAPDAELAPVDSGTPGEDLDAGATDA
ncbi:MAG: hypothetical protein QM765_24645 [Myxococcales bacterium]